MKEKVTVTQKDVGVMKVGPGGATKIVAGTGAAVKHRTGLSKAIEGAMQQAILDAAKEGIGPDKPDEIRERMRVAREKVIAEYEKRAAAPEPAQAASGSASGNST